MNINDIFYRRDSKKIYIKKPDLIELSYTQRLWNDTDTMADVGKVVDFPRYKWETFYKRSVNPTDGKNFIASYILMIILLLEKLDFMDMIFQQKLQD